MFALNVSEDTLVAHIVFDGPPHPHKSTNLRHLCASLPRTRRTELFVAPGEHEENPLLQYICYNGGFIAGRPLSSHLVGIPDPGTHEETRGFLLERADVLVYVCSLDVLENQGLDAGITERLQGRPAIVQVFGDKNKLDADALRERLSLPSNVTIIPTDLTSGEGAREALVSAIRLAANELRVRLRDGGPAALPDVEWASPQELLMLLGLVEETGDGPLDAPEASVEEEPAASELSTEPAALPPAAADVATDVTSTRVEAPVDAEPASSVEPVVEAAAEAATSDVTAEDATSDVLVAEGATPIPETRVDDIFDEAEALLDGEPLAAPVSTPSSPVEAIEPLLQQSSKPDIDAPESPRRSSDTFTRPTDEKTKKVKRPKSIVEEHEEAVPPAMRVMRQGGRRGAQAAARAASTRGQLLGHSVPPEETYETVDIDLSELDDIISSAIDEELDGEIDEPPPLRKEWLQSHPDLEPVSLEQAHSDSVWKTSPPKGPFETNFIWPEDASELIESIPFEEAVRRDDLVGQQGTSDGSGRSDVQIYQVGDWCLKTSMRSRFKSRSQALRALVTLSRSKQRLKHWQPPNTIIAIQPDDKGFFWVWTLTDWLSTLRGQLEAAAERGDEQGVGDALVSFAEILCESVARVSREGLLVDLHPSNFATDGDTYYYLDDDISTGRRIPVIGYALLQRVEEYKAFPEAVARYLEAFEERALDELSSIEANMLRVIEFIRSTPVRSPVAQEARQRLARHLSRRRKRHT